MKFYVYEHWRPDLDLCFYVGKGKGRRAVNIGHRNREHAKVVAELAAQGMCVEVRMFASDLAEDDAFFIEVERIRFWRSIGVVLANFTDGGEGFSGFVRPRGIKGSPESRAKLSASRMGIQFTPEHRAKLAAKKLGKARPPFTEETRAKMRAASAIREAAKREKFGDKVRRTSRIRETT